MRHLFYFHPDRRPDVDKALQSGYLIATPEELVEHQWMPMADGNGRPVLGWWVEQDATLLKFPDNVPPLRLEMPL